MWKGLIIKWSIKEKLLLVTPEDSSSLGERSHTNWKREQKRRSIAKRYGEDSTVIEQRNEDAFVCVSKMP